MSPDPAPGPALQPSRPTRVRGGPGSGKTSLLARVVADRLGSGADPSRIVVVTASHAAAGEFRSLLDSRLAPAYSPPRILTHERLARWIIGATGGSEPTVLSPVGEWVALGAALERARPLLGPLARLGSDPGCLDDLLDVCGGFKQALVGPGLLAERLAGEVGVLAEATVVAAAYQDQLAAMRARDTKDLAGDALGRLDLHPGALVGWADLLVVDQAEDLSPAQWYLVRELVERLRDPRAALMSGDPLVASAGYSGPSPRCFEELLPSQLRPDEWRLGSAGSPGEALAAAWGLAASPPPTAELLAGNPDPPAAVRVWRFEDDVEEAFTVAREIRRARLEGELEYDEVAVVVPGQALTATARALASAGVPARVERLSWSDSPVTGQLLDWLRALCSPLDEEAILGVVQGGIGPPSGTEVLGLRRTASGAGVPLAAALRSLAGSGGGGGPLRDRADLWRDLGGGDPGLRDHRVDTEVFLDLLGRLELDLGLVQLALSDSAAAAALSRMNLAAEEAGVAREGLRLPPPTLVEWLQTLDGALTRSGWEPERPPITNVPEVSVLTLSRTQGRHWKRVFLTGVAQGSLPGPPPRMGLLGPEDRQRLVEQLPELEEVMGPAPERLQRERRRFILGMSRATQETTVTWARRYGERVVEDSPFAAALEGLGHPASRAPGNLDVTEADCLAALAAALAGEQGPPPPGIPEEALRLAGALAPWDPAAPAPGAMGNPLSPTSLRRWLACPRLLHFHRLQIDEPETRPVVQGTAAHRLLERLYRDRTWRDGVEFRSRALEVLRREILPWVRERLLDPLESLAVAVWLDRFVSRWTDRVAGPGSVVGVPIAHEVGFVVARAGYQLRGRVDAIWRLPSGPTELVDYKTSAGSPPSRAGLLRSLLGDEGGPPNDWQLAIYRLAARAGALEWGGVSPPPEAARYWYLGQDPSSRVATGLGTRGYRFGDDGETVEWHEALVTPAMEATFEELLDREAAAALRGFFPAAPRHREGTCLAEPGCPWGDCCDGAGTVGRGPA